MASRRESTDAEVSGKTNTGQSQGNDLESLSNHKKDLNRTRQGKIHKYLEED